MAKMLKKLQQKSVPKKTVRPERPTGKGYMILGIIVFTTTLTIAGWEVLDAVNRAMYVLLTISLLLTYTSRYQGYRLSEAQHMIVSRVSLATIGLAAALFFVELYQRFAA